MFWRPYPTDVRPRVAGLVVSQALWICSLQGGTTYRSTADLAVILYAHFPPHWPVTAVCLGSMWLCLLSIAYLPAATHAQPHMRKPPERRRGERRDAGESHTSHRRRLSRGCARPGARRPTPRRAPRVARLTPCDSVARVIACISALTQPARRRGRRRAPHTALQEARSRPTPSALERGNQLLATRARIATRTAH